MSIYSPADVSFFTEVFGDIMLHVNKSDMLKRTDIRQGIDLLIVFGLTLSLYVATMPGTISLEDAGLFQMVCHLGGISHPPGYPLFTTLCQSFVSFPFFPEGVFAGNLLSAIFASAACMVLFSCCQSLTDSRSISYIAALAYGLSATFWSQAIIIEVYSLAVLMFLLCFRLLLSYNQCGDIRYIYAVVLVYSLALTNHWPLMILSTPALLAVVSSRMSLIVSYLKSGSFWASALILVAIGLSPYVTIVMQSDPSIAVFGEVSSFSGFLEYLARSAYSDGHVASGLTDRMQYSFWLLNESATQFGLLSIPFLLVGIFVSIRSLPLAFNISLILMYLSGTFALNMLLNFRYDFFWQAIFRPYPVISYVALAIWFALGVSAFGNWLAIRTKVEEKGLSFAISVIVLISIFVANQSRNNRTESIWVEEYGRSVLESLPENAVFFLRGDFEFGLFGYLHEVRGLRPDIELRGWDNLVFSNRLSSPAASPELQAEKRAEFLDNEDRPVYSISAPLVPSAQLGGYYRYTPGKVRTAERNPGMDHFLDYLLDLYLGGLITDSHEIYFAFYRLVNFSRQYVALALTRSDLSEVELQRLNRLQSTFPGKLATLETLISLDQREGGKKVLLEMAGAAEEQMPEFITNESQAVFYEFYGRALAMKPSDDLLAISYFEKSMETLPVITNTSLCPLVRLHRSNTHGARLHAIVAQFPDLECL